MTELERLAFLERQAEEAYDAMYEAHSPSHAAAYYSDAKEALYSAIMIAQQLGADDAVNVSRLALPTSRQCFDRSSREALGVLLEPWRILLSAVAAHVRGWRTRSPSLEA